MNIQILVISAHRYNEAGVIFPNQPWSSVLHALLIRRQIVYYMTERYVCIELLSI